jgi:hypothetical protein
VNHRSPVHDELDRVGASHRKAGTRDYITVQLGLRSNRFPTLTQRAARQRAARSLAARFMPTLGYANCADERAAGLGSPVVTQWVSNKGRIE